MQGVQRRIIVIVLFTSLLINGYLGYRLFQCRQRMDPQDNDHYALFGPRGDRTPHVPFDSTATVLFGDSHFEIFPMHLLPAGKIKNLGISGQTSRGLLFRMGALVRVEPRTIILCIGINDINNGRSLKELQHDVSRLLDGLRHGSPRTRLVVLSLPPISDPRAHAMVIAHNTWLQDACAQRGLRHLDITSPLMKGGVLDPDYTYDGLHLNDAGYQVLAGLLGTHI